MRSIIGFLALTALAAADTTIGTATARPGQRATGFLQVPAGSDATASIPVIVISGAKPRLTPRNTYETKYPAANRKKTRIRTDDSMWDRYFLILLDRQFNRGGKRKRRHLGDGVD